MKSGLPEAAAAAAADVFSSPGAWLSTTAGGRAAWSALGAWAQRQETGTEGTLRWLLGALELPADAAPSIVTLLDEESQAGDGDIAAPATAEHPAGATGIPVSAAEHGRCYPGARQFCTSEFLSGSSAMFHSLLEWCAHHNVQRFIAPPHTCAASMCTC